jgi:membrane protein
MRASNIVYSTEESRPFWKLRPLQIAITLGMMLLVALLALSLVLTGPIVDAIAEPVGIGSTAVSLWNVLKWPAMVAVFVLILSVLYYTSPDAELRGFRWVTPGSVVALVVWAIASAGFALYVANFGSYDKTYGTLAGLIVLIVWLWITNLAILFGQVLNAQLERERTARRSPS